MEEEAAAQFANDKLVADETGQFSVHHKLSHYPRRQAYQADREKKNAY
jgi:hypothetical protein